MNEIIRILGAGQPDKWGDPQPGETLYELPATVRPMPSSLVGDDKAETGRQYFQITIDTTADGTPRPGVKRGAAVVWASAAGQPQLTIETVDIVRTKDRRVSFMARGA